MRAVVAEEGWGVLRSNVRSELWSRTCSDWRGLAYVLGDNLIDNASSASLYIPLDNLVSRLLRVLSLCQNLVMSLGGLAMAVLAFVLFPTAVLECWRGERSSVPLLQLILALSIVEVLLFSSVSFWQGDRSGCMVYWLVIMLAATLLRNAAEPSEEI